MPLQAFNTEMTACDVRVVGDRFHYLRIAWEAICQWEMPISFWTQPVAPPVAGLFGTHWALLHVCFVSLITSVHPGVLNALMASGMYLMQDPGLRVSILNLRLVIVWHHVQQQATVECKRPQLPPQWLSPLGQTAERSLLLHACRGCCMTKCIFHLW